MNHRPLPLWLFVLMTVSGIRIAFSLPEKAPARVSNTFGTSSVDTVSSPLPTSEVLHPRLTTDIPGTSQPSQVLDVSDTSFVDTTLRLPSQVFDHHLRPLSMDTVDLSPRNSDVRPSTSTAVDSSCILRMEDFSKYSSSFLSNSTTFPCIEFEDGSIYRLEIDEPDPTNELMNANRERIRETPEKMETATQELADLLKNDEELHTPWENTAWLIRFLRARKYDVQKTYELIKNYYKFKKKNNSVFENLTPSEEQDGFEQEVIVALPQRDKSGRRIVIARANKWKEKEYPVDKMCRMAVVLLEFGVYEPSTQLAGIQIILDLKEVAWPQFLSILDHLFLLARMVDGLQNCVPLRIEGIHVVNEPGWFGKAYKIVKHILTKEIKKMLKVHGENWKALCEEVGDSNLPIAYGGKIPLTHTIPGHMWKLILEHQDPEFEKIRSYGIIKETSLASRWGTALRGKIWGTGR